MHSGYDDAGLVENAVAAGAHREFIGGLWDELGQLQLDFLIARGLQPASRLLDIGCGSLRLGVRAAPYLDPGHYFGTDINAALIEAGRLHELTPEGRERLPPANLSASADFDFNFLPAPMDFGIAQSVFTHLPLNHLRRCLAKAAPKFRVRAKLYVTAFLIPAADDLFAPHLTSPGGVITHDWCDPYHYRPGDVAYAAAGLPWRCTVLGAWGHPRGQQMIEYERI